MARAVAVVVLVAAHHRGALAATRCPRSEACTRDAGRFCAKAWLGEDAALSRTVDAALRCVQESGLFDDDRCYLEPKGDKARRLESRLLNECLEVADPAAQAAVDGYLMCVEKHGLDAAPSFPRECEEACRPACREGTNGHRVEFEECRVLCSIKRGCLAENVEFVYDVTANDLRRGFAMTAGCKAAFESGASAAIRRFHSDERARLSAALRDAESAASKRLAELKGKTFPPPRTRRKKGRGTWRQEL